LQSGNRATEVAVLRVVFVFNYPCVRAGSPTKQFQAAIRGHGDAHRKLIRWRDVGEFRSGRELAACLYDEAICVHRYWNNSGTGSTECLKSAGVTRVFHPDLIARGEKETADEVEGLLSA
jgi:hypothetical protein